MRLTLSTHLLDAIQARAAASPHAEVCGLLLGEGTCVVEARACRNVAADPARRFEIDPGALIAAYRDARAGGPAVIGHYHSHPSGRAVPSAQDAADAAGDGAVWLIVTADQAGAWRSTPGGFVPLAIES